MSIISNVVTVMVGVLLGILVIAFIPLIAIILFTGWACGMPINITHDKVNRATYRWFKRIK